MTARLLALKRIYGGDLHGRTLTMPTFGHPPKDRGTSVTDDPSAPDSLLVKVHNGGGRADDIATKNRLLADLGEADRFQRREKPSPVDRMAARAARAKAQREAKAEAEAKTRAALRILRDVVPITGTPAADYLASRGVPYTGEALTWHPSCPFGQARTGAMVAIVTAIGTGEVRAIHRTAIDARGRKVEVGGVARLSFGPIGDGAVRLLEVEGSDVLGVAEGIESALSLPRLPAWPGGAVWSLLAANGIRRLPVLPQFRELWIAVDHDPAGIQAAKECALRWRKAGCDVVFIMADAPGADLNDKVRELRHG